MGYGIIVSLVLLTQLAVSIDSTSEESKSGIPTNGQENSALQPPSSQTIEGQSSDSSLIHSGEESATTVGEVTSIDSAENTQPDASNSGSESSSSPVAEKETLESEKTKVEESTDPGESNSYSDTYENNETQKNIHEEKNTCSGGIGNENSSVLVITSDSQPQTNAYDVYINDIPTKLYIPRRGNKYVELKDESTTVWKAKEDEYSYMVYLVSKSAKIRMIMIMARGITGNKYCYKKEGNKWEKITTFWYHSKIFMPLESEKPFNVYELDIGEKNNENCILVDCYIDHVHTKMYFDKIGNKVGTIKHSKQILHKINFIFETLSKVEIILLDEKPLFVDIELFNIGIKRNIRFEIINGAWEPISNLNYRNKMKMFRKCEEWKREVSSGFIPLYINEVKEDKIQIIERSSTSLNVASREYRPKPGYKLGYIISNRNIIWTNLEEEEDCSVLTTYNGDMPELVMIEYRKIRHKEYLKNENNKWYEIGRSEYLDKMTDLYKE